MAACERTTESLSLRRRFLGQDAKWKVGVDGISAKGLRQNHESGVMWKRFSRRSAPNPVENTERIRQQLQSARLLIQQQKANRAKSAVASSGDCRSREILPSDEPDATIPHHLLPARISESTLAAAVESILQGQKVSAELFTQLYRGGFVFKSPHGQWSITAMGKELIERYKLLTPEGCLVAGVRCPAGWNK